MQFDVIYTHDGTTRSEKCENAEQAIDSVCRLLDAGHIVTGILSPLSPEPIGKDVIAQIYRLWTSAPKRLCRVVIQK